MKTYHNKKHYNKWKDQTAFSLMISLHNPKTQGYNLESVVDWINKQESFVLGRIDIADTLYRHNYEATGLTTYAALQKSYHFGQRWLQNNLKYLSKLKAPYYVTRWDTWLEHPEYQITKIQVQKAYNSNQHFKIAVHNMVRGFYDRRGINSNHILPKKMSCSINFVLEEIAGDLLNYRDFSCVCLHTSSEAEPYTLIRAGKVPELPSGLEKTIHTALFQIEENADLMKIAA